MPCHADADRCHAAMIAVIAVISPAFHTMLFAMRYVIAADADAATPLMPIFAMRFAACCLRHYAMFH